MRHRHLIWTVPYIQQRRNGCRNIDIGTEVLNQVMTEYIRNHLPDDGERFLDKNMVKLLSLM